MNIVLVSGLWLDGSAWDLVVPPLSACGHRTVAVELPVAGSADERAISLTSVIDAVVEVVDGLVGDVVLVGHSAGCGVVSAALDRRVDRIEAMVLVGGFPARSGRPILDGFDTVAGAIPLPDWSDFDEADLVGLDAEARRVFRDRAVRSPACLATDPVILTDRRRYDVPVTAVCNEYSSEQLRSWIGEQAGPVAELPHYSSLAYVDVPTGHWPMLTRPDDLAAAILGAIGRD